MDGRNEKVALLQLIGKSLFNLNGEGTVCLMEYLKVVFPIIFYMQKREIYSTAYLGAAVRSQLCGKKSRKERHSDVVEKFIEFQDSLLQAPRATKIKFANMDILAAFHQEETNFQKKSF